MKTRSMGRVAGWGRLMGRVLAMTVVQGALRAGEVSTASLVGEMTDFRSVARWPEPEFECLQASSYDRRTVGPDQGGWFANDDHTQFIRMEQNQGRTERVMLDAEGPGALVRFWLTTVQNKRGTLRIYLDGGAEPALVFPAFDLMASDLAVPESFLLPHPGYTREGNGGNTLMLPVPYAKHCKVTWEEQGSGPRYYQINYRSYPPGTAVRTFRAAEVVEQRGLLDKAAALLKAPPAAVEGRPAGLGASLAPGAEAALDLPAGPAALAMMRFSTDAGSHAGAARALRSLIVRIAFDGEETVWCPASDFFGSGAGINPLQSWYRTVHGDGTMICRWVMPYKSAAKITLMNLGEQPLAVALDCRTQPWAWDARSMHFHTAWHAEAGLKTPPQRDWNFIKLQGRGVYVGDTLSLFNRVATWYGEGDEKIRVDGDRKLWHLGTGTEDYYGYSFAPRGIMQTPFANQIRVDGEQTQGHNILTRTRNLDGIPFRKELDFDIELISWQPTKLDYAATTHWYAFPGGRANAKPQPEEARAVVPALEQVARPASFPGVIEAEALEVVGKNAGLVLERQDMQVFGFDEWSGGAQLLAKAEQVGDYVVLRIPATAPGKQRLSLQGTKAKDYGILAFTVNGKAVAERFDGFAEKVSTSGDFGLGVFEPVGGAFLLRVEVAGTSPQAVGPKYYFGIDSFKLEKAE